MRALTILSLSAAALALSACATAGSGRDSTYLSALDRLAADCQARGGILASNGSNTGRPEVDNHCRMTTATRTPG